MQLKHALGATTFAYILTYKSVLIFDALPSAWLYVIKKARHGLNLLPSQIPISELKVINRSHINSSLFTVYFIPCKCIQKYIKGQEQYLQQWWKKFLFSISTRQEQERI